MPSKNTKSKRPVVCRTSPPSCSPIPCPFCGKKCASLTQNKSSKSWQVFCNLCLAMGPYSQDVNEALELWGRRENPTVEPRVADLP